MATGDHRPAGDPWRTATARELGLDPDSPFLEVLLARVGRDAPPPPRPAGTSVELVAGAVAALRRGAPVLVVDSRPHGVTGHLVQAAGAVGPAALGLLTDLGTGLVGVALPARRCAELRLTPMVADQSRPQATVYAVSVDAAGTSSGASPADRLRTIGVLAAPGTVAADLRSPGHVFPLIARSGGVLDGGGPAEAAVELVQLAGLPPAAVVCEVGGRSEPDGDPDAELTALARGHGLTLLRLDDLLVHQRLHQGAVRVGATTRLPVPTGGFTAELLVSAAGTVEVLALRLGDLAAGADPPLVRVHVECLLGDALGSRRCDCGERLGTALADVAAAGRGVLLYQRADGTGVLDLLAGYAAADAAGVTAERAGSDRAGHPAPRWDAVADALHVLGLRAVRLPGADPGALVALGRLGIGVEQAEGAARPA
ncbi:3,4-dihydroxy-2-butanone-4-phosphate synthase [Geodermatophilus sp. SYSU D00710]